MEFVCRRCQHITKQTLYRVTSEEEGVVLINMLVCAACARLAKRLGLPVVRMKWEQGAAEPKPLYAAAASKQELVPRLPQKRTDGAANAGAVLRAKSKPPLGTFLVIPDQNGRRGRARERR